MSRKRVIYYPDPKGRTPVLEFLRSVSPDERSKAASYVGYLQEQGEALRRPIAEYLGGKIYELRPKGIRMLYGFIGSDIVVMLHAFRKMTRQVPAREMRCARYRLADCVARIERGEIEVRP